MGFQHASWQNPFASHWVFAWSLGSYPSIFMTLRESPAKRQDSISDCDIWFDIPNHICHFLNIGARFKLRFPHSHTNQINYPHSLYWYWFLVHDVCDYVEWFFELWIYMDTHEEEKNTQKNWHKNKKCLSNKMFPTGESNPALGLERAIS